MPIPVVLFRPSSRSCSTSSPDPYAYLLSQPSPASCSPSYASYFVPIFHTGFVQEDALVEILQNGASQWSGVVITSQRAVDAWGQAAERVTVGETGRGKGKAVRKGEYPAVLLSGMRDLLTASVEQSAVSYVDKDAADASSLSWDAMPFFSVGSSTTQALLALPTSLSPSLLPDPHLIYGSDQAGNASALATIIISHFAASVTPTTQPTKPLLYLTGDKNSPVLGQSLASASPPLPVIQQQVYETILHPAFESTVDGLLDELSPREEQGKQRPWMVLFSPSAIPLVLGVLRRRGLMEAVRFAAIGPTTRDALIEIEGIVADEIVAAAKPSAGSLVEALRNMDGL